MDLDLLIYLHQENIIIEFKLERFLVRKNRSLDEFDVKIKMTHSFYLARLMKEP